MHYTRGGEIFHAVPPFFGQPAPTLSASNKAFTNNAAIRPALQFQAGGSGTSHTYRRCHRFAPATGSLRHTSRIFFPSQLLGETVFDCYCR